MQIPEYLLQFMCDTDDVLLFIFHYFYDLVSYNEMIVKDDTDKRRTRQSDVINNEDDMTQQKSRPVCRDCAN